MRSLLLISVLLAVLAAAPAADGANRTCTRLGTPGDDVMYSGSRPAQTLCGLKGADLLNAADGVRETLRGGRGGDVLNGRGCVGGCILNCGLGVRDVAYADAGELVLGCETVHRRSLTAVRTVTIPGRSP